MKLLKNQTHKVGSDTYKILEAFTVLKDRFFIVEKNGERLKREIREKEMERILKID